MMEDSKGNKMKDKEILKKIQKDSDLASGASAICLILVGIVVLVGGFMITDIKWSVDRIESKINRLDSQVDRIAGDVGDINNEIYGIDLDTNIIRQRVLNCK